MTQAASTWEWEKQGRYMRWRQVFGTAQWEVDKHWYHLFGFLSLFGKPVTSVGNHYFDLSSSFPEAMFRPLKDRVLLDDM
jgi:hypothetical protein